MYNKCDDYVHFIPFLLLLGLWENYARGPQASVTALQKQLYFSFYQKGQLQLKQLIAYTTE